MSALTKRSPRVLANLSEPAPFPYCKMPQAFTLDVLCGRLRDAAVFGVGAVMSFSTLRRLFCASAVLALSVARPWCVDVFYPVGVVAPASPVAPAAESGGAASVTLSVF